MGRLFRLKVGVGLYLLSRACALGGATGLLRGFARTSRRPFLKPFSGILVDVFALFGYSWTRPVTLEQPLKVSPLEFTPETSDEASSNLGRTRPAVLRDAALLGVAHVLSRLKGGHVRIGCFRGVHSVDGNLLQRCHAALVRALELFRGGGRPGFADLAQMARFSRGQIAHPLARALRAASIGPALGLAILGGFPACAQESGCFTGGYSAREGDTHPFSGLGGYGPSAILDLDDDGDLDCVLGGYYGGIFYIRNIGSATTPVYSYQAGENSPFDGINLGYADAPAFADLDDDGDEDLVVGSEDGKLYYFENTGSAASPVFTSRTGTINPFNSVDLGEYSAPTLGDLDGDGDEDAVVGEATGELNFLQNVGTPQAPEFVQQSGGANPFVSIDVGSRSTPNLVRASTGGIRELFIGDYTGKFGYFSVNQTLISPFFKVVHISNNYQLTQQYDGGYEYPQAADFDGDGDRDFIAGSPVVFFENRAGETKPTFVEGMRDYDPFDDLSIWYTSAPALVDIDGDGDQDAFFGQVEGTVTFFRNEGNASAPMFVPQEGLLNPLGEVNVYIGRTAISAPTFSDLDGDDDFDFVIGDGDGKLSYFENVGTASVASFEIREGSLNPFDGVDSGTFASVSFVDLDGDGDLDGAVSGNSGTLRYFERANDPLTPTFTELTGALNPFDGIPVEDVGGALFLDIDDDNDQDLFILPIWRQPYYVNRGTNTEPHFVQEDGKLSPLYSDEWDDGFDAYSGAVSDLNGDGAMDFVFGHISQKASYYRRIVDCSPPTAVCQDTSVVLGDNGVLRFSAEMLDGGSTSPDAGIAGGYATPYFVDCGDLGTLTVSLNVYDSAYGSDTCTSVVTVLDLTAPVIASVEAINLSCGDVYVDALPAATDACDDFVVVQATGIVDTTTPGVYNITYDAVDASGNVAAPVVRTVTVIDDCIYTQSADQNADFAISLSELLRVIQFYNSGGLHCDVGSEDGFGAGPVGDQSCTPYDTDYNPQDWAISLTELLRVIQFYNSSGYSYCPASGSEDGFCAGPG